MYLISQIRKGGGSTVLCSWQFSNSLNSHWCHFSIYQICVKYKKEWTSRKAVDDNKESMMDGEFLDLQMEKSTEGLSESSVQFMLQAVFFVSLIILAVYSVIVYISLHKYFGKCV